LLWNMTLLGKISMEEGELDLIDCGIEGTDRAADEHPSRALAILGGSVGLTRTVLHGQAGGAVSIEGATLILVDSSVHDCHTTFGGAILVRGRSMARIRSSNFTSNSASVSGGAIHISEDANMTIESSVFVKNSAAACGGRCR
jgi:predicted outer membrane repeat protein